MAGLADCANTLPMNQQDTETPDDKRVRKLRDYNILDTPPELDFDELTQLAAQICNTPVAVISFVDKERQWFKARIGTDMEESPRSESFCTHTIQLVEDQVFVVNDTLKDERFAESPLVTGPEQIRFYAGAPIVTRDGHAIGAICAIDQTPRTLTDEQLVALRSLARHVMNDLEMRRLQQAHSRARRELYQTRVELDSIRTRLRPEAAAEFQHAT